MAHSHKRRKLSTHLDHSCITPVGHNPHNADEIPLLSLQELRTPPRIEEVHVRISSERAMSRSHKEQADLHQRLHRRQLSQSDSTFTDPGTITSAALTTPSGSVNNTAETPFSTTFPPPLSTGLSISANGTNSNITATPFAFNSSVSVTPANVNVSASVLSHSITSLANVSTSSTSSGYLVTTLPDGVVTTLFNLQSIINSAPTAFSTPTSTAVVLTTAQPSSTSSSAAGSTGSISNDGSSNATPPASIIAGGVVGGVAGIAVLALIAMLFVRWYRRKGGQQRIADAPDVGPTSPTQGPPRQMGMAERAGTIPLASAAAALLGRGSHNSSAAPSGERGFQRLSGRKLPSAFSEGMTAHPDAFRGSRPVAVPAAFRSNPEHPFFRDSVTHAAAADEDSGSSHHTGDDPSPPAQFRPGPVRRPTLHPGGPYHVSEGESPFADPPEFASRSATMIDFEPGSYNTHSSRFTEEV